MKPGYKQTEIGLIPEEWELFTIGELGDGNRPAVKAGPFGSALKKDCYVATGFKVYGQEQVIRGDHLFGDYFIDRQKYRELENCAVRAGDVLLSLVGTAGKVLLLPDDAAPGVINPRLLRLSLSAQKIIPRFLVALIGSEIFQSQLLSLFQGGTMGVLNAHSIRSVQLVVPPPAEQIAIAAALSDADAAIASLERLVAKKRDLKRAAMQQLLTGQTRLPGFSGAWETKRLGELLRVRHGKSQKFVEDPNGDYPILATGGVIGRASKPLYDKPSVLIGRKGTIDRPQFMDTPFWSVDTLFYTEMLAESVAKFLYYRFLLMDWRRYNEASGVPSLNAKTIEDIEIKIGRPKEQAAIASVLSEIDAELTVLEAQLEKTRLIKRAMMQELLTGRTRLPIKEAVDA